MQYLLDTRNYRCPLPLLMCKQALKLLDCDDELTLLLSGESDIQDIALLCRQQGCYLTIVSANRLTICKQTV